MAVVDPNVDEDDVARCGASAQDWALLILTMLAVNVNWWLFKIPILFYKGPKAYFNGVAWQCVRNCLPGVAAYLTLRETKNPEVWATFYYRGPISREADEEGNTRYRTLTMAQYAKYAFSDTIIVIATIMSMVQFCTAPADADLSGLNSSMWTYPTLPVAVNGFFLFGMSYLRSMTLRRRYVALILFLTHGIILAAFALAMRFGPERDRGLWYPAIFLYIIMATPLAMIRHFILIVAMTALPALARVGPVAAGAMSDGNAYFPYCGLRNKVFGGIYLALGLLAGVLAFYGRVLWSPEKLGLLFVKQFWFVLKRCFCLTKKGEKPPMRYRTADGDIEIAQPGNNEQMQMQSQSQSEPQSSAHTAPKFSRAQPWKTEQSDTEQPETEHLISHEENKKEKKKKKRSKQSKAPLHSS